MKRLLGLWLCVALWAAAGIPVDAARCVGASPCKACKTCRYCAHCAKGGGTCGICARGHAEHRLRG